MHIAFISGWFLEKNKGSGAGTFIQDLKNGLEKKGVTIDLITPNLFNQKSYYLAMLGRIIKNFTLPIYFYRKKTKYDLIVGFDYDGFSLLFRKEPFVCCPRGILRDVSQTEYGISKIFLKFQGFFEQINLYHSDHVIVPSFYAKKSIQKYYKIPEEKISVIYNGIDEEKWKLNTKKTIETDSRVKILSVGKMYPRKNFPLLLKVFDLICKDLKNIELHILGDGMEFELVKKIKENLLSKEKIKLYGFVKDFNSLKKIYNQSTVFCNLSEQETFGNVTLEAMINSKPVIVLNKASMPEIVKDNYNGIIIDSMDPLLIAEKISALVSSPKNIKKFSHRAFQTAKLFTREKTIDSFYKKFFQISTFT